MKRRRRGTAIIETEKGILVTSGKNKIFLTPGGSANSKESRMQAAIRELKEETRLEPYFAMALFRFKGKAHRKFQDFHTVYFIKAQGKAKPCHEIKYIQYYKKNSNIKLSQSTKLIIKQYLKYKLQHKKLFELLRQF